MATRRKARTVWAYVAGIIDGEGYIGIDKSKTMPQRRCSPRYQPEVVVVNSYLPLLEWLQREFGGSIMARKKQKDHHKPTWCWKLVNRQAAEFCKDLLPYLLVKKQNAELLIEFMEAAKPPKIRGQGAKLSEAEVANRERLYQLMKARVDSRHPQRLSEMES